jgi:hypothetical protein
MTHTVIAIRSGMVERVVQIFRSFGLTRGGLRSSRVRAFAAAAAEGYRPNPYHNFYHGFHVLHATQLMLRSSAVRVSCPCLPTMTTSVTIVSVDDAIDSD